MKQLAGLLSIFIYLTLLSSCKPESFVEEIAGNVDLSFDYTTGRMPVPGAGSFSKTSEVVIIPVAVSLSGPASKIFNVSVETNTDTVKNLVAANVLSNTVALEATEFSLPNSVDVQYGSTTFPVNLNISTAVIEKYYGKDLAIAVKLAGPTRGNTLNNQKKTVIVIVKTTEVIGLNEIRNISFTNSGVFRIPEGTNYVSEANDFLIPLKVELTGDLSEQFIITNLVANSDTITKLMAESTLPSNTVNLLNTEDAFAIPATVQINSRKDEATVNLRINKFALLQNFGNKVALAFTLSNPSRFKVQASKSTVIILFDPARLFTDITGLMKNTARPFIASAKEPAGRWGKLADWITNDAVNNHVVAGIRYGSFDNNTSTNIAMESGFNAAPNITDGKIYQTITLPAGTYRYETVQRTGTGQVAYAVAVAGAGLPNTAGVNNTTTLANARLLSGGGTVSVTFTLNQSTQVSLGYVATLTGNQSVNIQSVKLVNVF